MPFTIFLIVFLHSLSLLSESDIDESDEDGEEKEKSEEILAELRGEDEKLPEEEQMENSFEELTEMEIEISFDEKPEEVPNEEGKECSEEVEKSFKEDSGQSSEEEPGIHTEEGVEKFIDELEKLPKEYDSSSDEDDKNELGELPDQEIYLLPDEVPEKSGVGVTAEVNTLPLVQQSAEIPIELYDDIKSEDDEQATSSDDDVTESRPNKYGGESVREENTVETIIVEKTHSEVSTTVTEITTKRYPSDPTVSPSEDDGVLIPMELVPGREIAAPGDDEPKPDDDYFVIPVEMEKANEDVGEQEGEESGDEVDSYERQPKLKRGSEDRSTDSESSLEDSEEKENLDNVLGECVSSEDRPGNEGPIETVVGILDIKYEKPQSYEETMAFPELPLKIDKIRTSSESSDSSVESPSVSRHSDEVEDVFSSQVCEVVASLPTLEPSLQAFEDVPLSEDVPKPDVVPSPDDVPTLEEVQTFESVPKLEEVPAPEQVPTLEDVPTPEDLPTTEDVPTPKHVPTPEDLPTCEDVPTPEDVPTTEDAPTPERILAEMDDRLTLESTSDEKDSDESEDDFDATWSGAQHIRIQTKECEAQTENDTFSETTQTEETTRVTRETSSMTKETYSITERSFESVDVFEDRTEEHQTKSPKLVIRDSDMQTESESRDVTTQTDLESSTDRKSALVEQERGREWSDGQTQTNIGVDDFASQTLACTTKESGSMTDGIRGAPDHVREAPTSEGTQTDTREEEEEEEEEESWHEDGITRTIRKTTKQTHSYREHVETVSQASPSSDFNADCPVCFQTLEETEFSFIKVSDPSRYVGVGDFSAQTEFGENATDEEPVLCSSCGGRQDTREHPDTREHRDTREPQETREHRDSRGDQETWENLETWEHSGTTVDEGEQEGVVESGSSSAGEPHLVIHIEGDEKCSLLCRRVGNHTCILKKLASIIRANRRATTGDRGATTSSAEQEAEEPETSENVDTDRDAPKSEEDAELRGDSLGSEASDVRERCDVSVQTEGAILPTDFEVFSEKDFEIYYDGQSSPWFV